MQNAFRKFKEGLLKKRGPERVQNDTDVMAGRVKVEAAHSRQPQTYTGSREKDVGEEKMRTDVRDLCLTP